MSPFKHLYNLTRTTFQWAYIDSANSENWEKDVGGTGEKPCDCGFCGESISLANTLIIHAEETPYQCDICEKLFSQNSVLIKHNHINTRKKPYHCVYQ
ncbi:cubilin-like [Octopus vulgaris]|uniref:Cubilin-like n=1 Tax=Octopus vulgaris TaxID=6645 RepID=A0AA36B6L0_OCTVU|nr:cubilin-like [Octopus vulgaris]